MKELRGKKIFLSIRAKNFNFQYKFNSNFNTLERANTFLRLTYTSNDNCPVRPTYEGCKLSNGYIGMQQFWWTYKYNCITFCLQITSKADNLLLNVEKPLDTTGKLLIVDISDGVQKPGNYSTLKKMKTKGFMPGEWRECSKISLATVAVGKWHYLRHDNECYRATQ